MVSMYTPCINPESLIRLKRISSVKNTRLHCWSLQLLRAWNYRKQRLLPALKAHTILVNSQINHLSVTPLAMVKRDIGCPVVCCMSFAISPVVGHLPVLVCRTSNRSYSTVVAHVRPLLNPLTAVTIVWNALQACDTMLWAITSSSVTLVSIRHSSNFPMILLCVKSQRCCLQDCQTKAAVRRRTNWSTSFNSFHRNAEHLPWACFIPF